MRSRSGRDPERSGGRCTRAPAHTRPRLCSLGLRTSKNNMTRIASIEVLQVDLPPPVPRSDAIQSFVTQETPIVRLRMDDGSGGTGYSYTIGTGGSSVVALLKDHLCPRLI